MTNTGRALTGFLAFSLGALSLASAAGSPVGTKIENTATVEYRDALNAPRTQDSNTIKLTVRQVYAVSVTPDAAADAIPAVRKYSAFAGGRQVVSYLLRNAGNGEDTFDLSVVHDASSTFTATTSLFLDADCNGVRDGAAITSVVVPAVQSGPGDQVCVLVEAAIPAATPGGREAKFALVATSSGRPAVTDTNNYAQLSVTPDGLLNLSGSVSPTGAVNPGDTLTYTIVGRVPTGSPAAAVTNVVTVDGTPRTGILVRDVLPAVEFVSVTSATASAGTPRAVYSTDGGVTWSFNAPASGVNAVGLLVEGSGAFLPVDGTLNLTFTVRVPDAAGPGTLSNAATAKLDGNGDGDGDDAAETPSTTTLSTSVNEVYRGAVGPYTYPLGTAPAGGPSYGLAGQTITRSGDTQTVTTPVEGGTAVSFRQTLQNTGNVSNDFTLAVTGSPSGWVCTVQTIDASDTLGALSNPVTVGAGLGFEFAVSCDVPLTAPAGSDTPLTVSVTPTGGSADTTTTTVAQVDPAGLPLLGNGDGSTVTAPSGVSVERSVPPGDSALFPLELLNRGPVSETLDLNGTVPGTQFFVDTNRDGLDNDGGPAVTAVTVASRGTAFLVARVPTSAGDPEGAVSTVFTAQSTLAASRVSRVTDSVRVNPRTSGSFTPNGAFQTIAGGTVTYSHTLRNTSNGGVTVDLPAYASAQGFTYSYSVSSTGPFAPTLSGLKLAAGASIPLYVRVSVPAGATAPVSEAAVITATLTSDAAPNPTQTVSVTDTTDVQTVIAGVVKTVEVCNDVTCTTAVPVAADDKVAPGDILRFTITVTNRGSSALSAPTIRDALPAGTEFVAVGGPAGLLFSTDDRGSWIGTAPTSLPLGRFYAGWNSNGDARIDASDLLPAGASFTVTFTVRVP